MTSIAPPPGFVASATQTTELDAPPNTTPWIGPQGQPMRRLELHLTYHCPERCVFCSEDHRMTQYNRFPVTWGRVARILRTHAERGVQSVHITGGEPTIHPRFIDVLRLARKLGMRTSIGTIGTRLSQRDFAEAAVPYLDEALFSIHGPDAATHDAVAGRAGSFDRVTRALRHCLDINPQFNVFANTVVCSRNIEQLPDTVEMLDRAGARLIVVSNTTPEGAAWDRFSSLTVPLATLKRVLPTVPTRAKSAVVRFFGVPMCLLGEHWSQSNDLHWDPRVTVEWQTAPGKVAFTGIYSWAPDRRRQHTAVCASCTRQAICMGVYDAVAENHDCSPLVPFVDEAAARRPTT